MRRIDGSNTLPSTCNKNNNDICEIIVEVQKRDKIEKMFCEYDKQFSKNEELSSG